MKAICLLYYIHFRGGEEILNSGKSTPSEAYRDISKAPHDMSWSPNPTAKHYTHQETFSGPSTKALSDIFCHLLRPVHGDLPVLFSEIRLLLLQGVEVVLRVRPDLFRSNLCILARPLLPLAHNRVVG